MTTTTKSHEKLMNLLITKPELAIENLNLVYVSDKSMPIQRCKDGDTFIYKKKEDALSKKANFETRLPAIGKQIDADLEKKEWSKMPQQRTIFFTYRAGIFRFDSGLSAIICLGNNISVR